ncbi:DNA-directed RNA polymerases II 24 kDa polypeptide (RNA polymerase II subunit 5) [Exophiala xenobiotica]|uniref:DNA-directed RNA polymerases I, II, and III subunit RPABC1 n=1 Tax=Vermiconidia calcicola TaxID=1690605 RepID=A0AAV9Q333_9PEZI|nr:DNA-directed RNA polymerases II 24 kDa polypeptide (RNA polymerase II subunit 5) [Exophiala xenobiotica]KAK5531961.1 DNA-directed RNA polymerases II 24 kDa polypeptide (RNA polymerase II subunit 5) [Vermiconidia calcicola]KAK5539512.1 DNA-directed RNA polymerases II 24 kDa polypeptide (RNA polymerase II subunit 5) [Chaetothyriales sp. CCFEE 6169]KAK5193413.1 DNA-directed RNA polymerases II 24 kDa polypeptide (RNA polymerase II subunit 5) [Exophiala xenobiotica]KAK5208859.1 DNA-directed RNA p
MDYDDRPKLSVDAEKEITRLWRTWRTVLEMLVDRGYGISADELTISRDQFQHTYCDKQTGIADRRMMRLQASPTPDMIKRDTPRPTKQNPDPSTTAGTIWVEFSPETTIGIKHLRAFAQHLDQHKFTTGVFITIGPVTAAALRAFEPLSERGITAEWFQEQDLLVNITRHELVPKHVLLSAEEKKVLLDRYRLKETQLPRIQYSDPVARYLGLKRGNVVKIIRKSETAGRYASYRWVF